MPARQAIPPTPTTPQAPPPTPTSAATPAPTASPAPTADRAADARLGHDASQAVFRALLDALARPGQPTRLPAGAAPGLPRALVPALALADVDLPVAVLAADDVAWHDVVRTATGATAAPLPLAELVVSLRPPSPAEVGTLPRGTADRPEGGGRLVVACRALEAEPSASGSRTGGEPGRLRIEVMGPGVPGVRAFTVAGIEPDLVIALADANAGHPAGVDTWLVADDGTTVGLPRSARLRAGTVD